MKRYIIEVTQIEDREQEGRKQSGSVNESEMYKKDYYKKRWGDLIPEDRKFLLSDYSLTDIDAWRKGQFEEFSGDGKCYVDLNSELCCIVGLVYDGKLYISEDAVIFSVG